MIKQIIKYLTFFVIPSSFVQSCNDVKVGIPDYSYSVKNSKKKNTFISRYKSSPIHYIENNKTYTIGEVWSEYATVIKNKKRELKILPNIYLMIRLDENIMPDMNTIYKNGKGEKVGMGYTNGTMFYELNGDEQKEDTIKLYFFNNNRRQLIKFVKTN